MHLKKARVTRTSTLHTQYIPQETRFCFPVIGWEMHSNLFALKYWRDILAIATTCSIADCRAKWRLNIPPLYKLRWELV